MNFGNQDKEIQHNPDNEVSDKPPRRAITFNSQYQLLNLSLRWNCNSTNTTEGQSEEAISFKSVICHFSLMA